MFVHPDRIMGRCGRHADLHTRFLQHAIKKINLPGNDFRLDRGKKIKINGPGRMAETPRAGTGDYACKG